MVFSSSLPRWRNIRGYISFTARHVTCSCNGYGSQPSLACLVFINITEIMSSCDKGNEFKGINESMLLSGDI